MTVALTFVKLTCCGLPPATAHHPARLRLTYPGCMSSTTASAANDATRHFNIVVIGAGQAGLSAAGTLHRRGLVPGADFAVLDGNAGPGGAWRHRWDALTLGRAHGVHDLPGFPLEHPDTWRPASEVVAEYYGAYEDHLALQVIRPAKVRAVTQYQDGLFYICTEAGDFTAAAAINATGTWETPNIPHYPGLEHFKGEQWHTKTFRDVEDFRDHRVLVVGGGASATQFLMMLEDVTDHSVWVSRSLPRWNAAPFDPGWGRAVEQRVTTQVTAGYAPRSVVSNTGLPLDRQTLAHIDRGTLVFRGFIDSFGEHEVTINGPGPDGATVNSQGQAVDDLLRAGDPAVAHLHDNAEVLPGHGTDIEHQWVTPIDSILWGTGFQHSLEHLDPLDIRTAHGGVKVERDGVTVPAQPGLFLVGYGASASTIGATRAGRKAAVAAIGYSS